MYACMHFINLYIYVCIYALFHIRIVERKATNNTAACKHVGLCAIPKLNILFAKHRTMEKKIRHIHKKIEKIEN